MYILICPVAVAQFIAVIYLCFETLSIITPTHPILITTIRCYFQGPFMVIVPCALNTTYIRAGISFVLQDSVGMNATDRSDMVTVCVLVGFSLLSCCRMRKHSARAELEQLIHCYLHHNVKIYSVIWGTVQERSKTVFAGEV